MAEKESAKDRLAKMIQESSQSKGSSKSESKPQKIKTPKKKAGFLQLIKLVNFLFLLGIVACVVLLFNEFNSGKALVASTSNLQNEASFRKVRNANTAMPNIQRLSYYLANLSERNLFQPVEKEEEIAMDNSKPSSSNISRKTSTYRLVGVAWFETVESASAMIEDTNKQVTYFLQRGDKIGDVIVKTIYADSVELGYQNEEIILEYEKSQM